jgi:hypothetical protein
VASRPPEPADTGSRAVEEDLDDVDATSRWVELGRQPTQPGGLGIVHCLGTTSTRGRGDGLHLDHDPLAADHREYVDLAACQLDVASENAHPPAVEECGGDVFPEGTDGPASRRRVAQIVGVGSSSSMLTSRKVSTRTRLTNRAGRYMSQTQASTSVSSK